MSKLGTGAVIVAGAAIAGYGFYEVGGSMVDYFNSIASPLAENTVKGLGAAFGGAVGAIGLGTFASKKWIEIKGAILSLVFAAAGGLGGGVGGWHLADHALKNRTDHFPAGVAQPAVLTQ